MVFGVLHERILGIEQVISIDMTVKLYSQKMKIILYCEHWAGVQ